jgi:CRISPR-associated protein Cas6
VPVHVLYERRLRLRFPVYGLKIPVDHAESLYAAVSSVCPDLHQAEDVSLSPIQGDIGLQDVLFLNRASHFYVQVHQDHVSKAMSLAGKTLRVQSSLLRVGAPSLTMITPSPTIYSRFVTVKNAVDESLLKGKILERLNELEIDECDIKVGRRRVIRIHGKKVVGFGVQLSHLDDESSVAVQALSIGGRRRYGAGFFMRAKDTEHVL